MSLKKSKPFPLLGHQKIPQKPSLKYFMPNPLRATYGHKNEAIRSWR